MFDLNEYKNPSAKYRAKPFWSLNGKLNKEELRKQILCMKEMGFGGVFLHSRTGLKTEYMGKEWLELMDYCVEVLKENGMEAYLYDEDRWPSGTCGGFVTEKEEYRQKAMAYIELNSDELPANTLAVFAVKLDDKGKAVGYRKIDSCGDKKDGERVFAFFWQNMLTNSFYNGFTYVDTMCREATETFIELTHEKYKSVMGDKFGKEIVGVFTDEPHRGSFFMGFSREEDNREIEIPYTPRLFEEFYARKGYRLEECLPVLWFGKSEDAFVKETYDYVEVLEELFLENFAQPYLAWCKENNLKLTGHILHEDNLAAQTIMSGSMMRFYEYMDYPGIDNLGSENNVYTVPALVSSVAKQLGKDFTLDEMYGVSGWPMNLSDYKRIGDWQAAGGITLRCPHLSWYTMEGEAKRDCPASILYQSAWYKEYRLIEDYFARLSYLMKNGEDTVGVAIINPIESTWGLSNQYTYYGFFDVKCPIYKKMEIEYAALYRDLKYSGITADYIDEGLFDKYGKAEGAEFVCGKKRYKTVILNGNYNLRATTLKAVKEFAANGGKVYLLGDAPEYLDGVKHDFTEDLKDAEKLPFDVKMLADKIKDDEVRVSCGNVMVERKKFGKDEFIFFLNQENATVNTDIRVKTDKNIAELNLRDGLISGVSVKREGDFAVIAKQFAPFEEYALYCSDDIKVAPEKDAKWAAYKTLDEFDYRLEEGNMLVLDRARLYIDGEFLTEDYILNADRKVRAKFGLEIRHGQMIQPWFKEKFGLINNTKHCRIRVEYDFNAEYIPARLDYMYETADGLELFVNGTPVSTEHSRKTPIDNCFTLTEIPCALLKKGGNTLAVEFDFYEKTDIEGGFLCGEFGVKSGDTDTITALPEKLKAGDLRAQGLPYFGGRIKLFAKAEDGEYLVKTDDMRLSAININGKTLAFKPLQAEISVKGGKIDAEIVLNRNNCFGADAEGDIHKRLKEQGFDKITLLKKQ